MKSLRTKVILSAFVLLFALVATIGSTYAWFTVSDTATVSTLNVTVTTEESLLIKVFNSADSEVLDNTVTDYGWTADSFVNTVTTSLITASTAYGSFSSYLLTPVTAGASPATTNGTDYAALDIDALSTIDIATTTSRALTPASANQTSGGGYIELKFWLMVQSGTDVTIQLSAFSATGATVANALYLGVKSSAINDSEVDSVYAIDSDWGFVFGATDTGYSATTALNSVQTIAALQLLEGTVNNSEVVATLSADIPELVTVRLWVEGWDAEATNSLMGESTDVTFSFQII